MMQQATPVRTHYVDVAGERLVIAFDEQSDATRFLELAELFSSLSIDELLIAIAQREGQSHLWKAFCTRRRRSATAIRPRAKATGQGPAVSGAQSDEFLQSFPWLRLRMEVLERDGAVCALCNRTRRDGIIINVDHIKPRKTHPHLALDANNCQVLCNECNLGKGNKFSTDWRQ